MKKIMNIVLILAVMCLGIPFASAEVYQDLDPMASPEPQATVTSENPVASDAVGQTSNVVSTADAVKTEKKSEKSKKEKSKKSSKKKSSKANSKSAEKHSKKKTSSKKSVQ